MSGSADNEKGLRVIIIGFINLKGGTGKTTSSAYAAHTLHDAGLRVLAVDADGENESLLSWQALGEFPFPVIGMAVPNIHRQLPGIVNGQYDAVVIDTPPMKERRDIVLSAARIATHIVCPLAPTSMEYGRLPAVRQLIDDATDLRDGRRPHFSVLLTRTVSNAASTEAFRELILEGGDHVLKPQVARLERFAQAYGAPIDNAANTAYGDAVAELLAMGHQEVEA